MKRFIQLGHILALVGIVAIVGCGNASSPGTSSSPGTLKKVWIDSTKDESCGFCFSDVCTRTYYLGAIDTIGGGGSYYFYYWAELGYNQDTLVGEYTRKHLWAGSIDTVNFPLTVHYFDLTPTTYLLNVYRVNDSAHARDRSQKQTSVMYQVPVLVPVWCTDCLDYCCSADTIPPVGWYYAQLEGAVNCIGVRATIRSRFGSLCGEPYGSSSKVAHSLAHVAMSRKFGSGSGWVFAEIGFLRRREHISLGGGYKREVFAQFKDSTGQYFTYTLLYDHEIDSICPEGTDCLYELQVDTSQGTPVFVIKSLYDSLALSAITSHTEWIGQASERVVVGGEIRGYESDMPGTQGDPCLLHGCGWYDGSYWSPTNFYNWDTIVSDTAQWKLNLVGQSEIRVWDRDTL